MLCRAPLLLLTVALHLGALSQAPPWVWAHGFGLDHASAATMDADHTNYYQVRFDNSATSPCGVQYAASGSGFYVVASDPADACLWSVQVPAHLGELYIAGPGQLRFRGWFEAPLQVGPTLFDPGLGTCYIDGAVDPIAGITDGQLVARASYELNGAPSQRMLRASGRVLMAVNFMDSVRLGSTWFTGPDTATVLAEFDEQGELSWYEQIGHRIAFPSSLAEDAGQRILLVGYCPDCSIAGDTVAGPGTTTVTTSFLSCLSADGQPIWNWLLPLYSDPGPRAIAAADGRVLLALTDANPFDLSFSSFLILLDADGQQIAQLPFVSNSSGIQTPIPAIDSDGGFIIHGYYIGSNPDQRIVKTDADLNELWSMNITPGNFWGIRVRPVALNTYLVTGAHEFNTSLGNHFLQWQGGFTNGFIAKLSDSTLGFGNPSSQPMFAWPNPVQGQLHFSANAGEPWRIVDARGAEVLTARADRGAGSIDVSSLTPGLYTIQVGGRSAHFVKE